MGSFGTDIRHTDHQIVHHLPLYIQVPGLNIRGTPSVSRNQDDAVLIVLRTWRKRPGGREDVCYAVVDLSRSEEHTSELQSQSNLVCRLLLEKKKNRTLSV